MINDDNVFLHSTAALNECPFVPILEFLSQKWLVNVIWLLGRNGTLRFSQLQKMLPGQISARVLSARLKQLENRGLVERDDKGTVPRYVTYTLSNDGTRLDVLLLDVEMLFAELSPPDTQDSPD